ncbi:hypothetical protein [Pseudomonas aeruginosa]|uniref:hypothetical protein n=1 Tax=Pseudomonas aeruginosa TaxID=287 RepID=UPI0021ADCAF7|nr:hypothetical protein [Pseudomonas aeruginosa]
MNGCRRAKSNCSSPKRIKGTDLFFGVYDLVKSWRETYAALEQLATSPEFRQQFGDNYLKGLEERAAFLTQAYEDAGWQGSVTAGVEGGRFAAELVGVLTAVKGGAQITAKLPTAAKNLLNAIAESPVSGSMSSQLGAVGDLGRLGGGQKRLQVPTRLSTWQATKGHSIFCWGMLLAEDIYGREPQEKQLSLPLGTAIRSCMFLTWLQILKLRGHN